MKNNEKWYINTEKMISQYWYTKQQIIRLEVREKVLIKNLAQLYVQLSEFKHIPGLITTYGVLKNSSRRGDYDYATLMEEYEELLNSLTRKIMNKSKKIIHTQYRLHQLKEWLTPIETIISKLTGEERILIEQRYFFKKSNYQIAKMLHCSEKRVRYMQNKTIDDVAVWIGKNFC